MRRFSFAWSLAAEAICAGDVRLHRPVAAGRPAGRRDGAAVPGAAQPRPADAGVRAAHGPVRRPAGRRLGVVEPAAGVGRPGGRCLLLAAVLIRCGTVPAHCWVTDWFEHASFGNALLFVTPLTGRLRGRPAGPADRPGLGAARASAWSSLVTAVYAAGMAAVQREARRFFAYLFLSHASLVLVGLELHTPDQPDRGAVRCGRRSSCRWAGSG